MNSRPMDLTENEASFPIREFVLPDSPRYAKLVTRSSVWHPTEGGGGNK